MRLTLLYPLISVLYLLVGWRFLYRARHAAKVDATWDKLALLPVLGLHLILLINSVSNPVGLNLSLGNVLSAIAWLVVLIYWLGGFFYRLEILLAPLTWMAALVLLAPLFLPADHVLANMQSPAFLVHLLIAFLAYSLLTIGALQATLMSVVEKRLHNPLRSSMASSLPPLLTLESMLFRIIGVGFILLSLTVLSGIFFSEELFHEPMQLNHKTVFAVLSWLVYAALLGGRYLWGWRGRTAVRWSLVGFVMLVLAYLGSKFVLEVILQR